MLDAVRALGRATSNEIAKRSGLPNGSVSVVLRSLAAAEVVTRAHSARGIEYRVSSRGTSV